jgi:hypothetical protein
LGELPDRLTITAPVPAVVIPVETIRFVPVMSSPAGSLVLTSPVNVVVPAPAVWLIETAFRAASAVTFVALLIVSAPRREPVPTAPSKSIFPVPASRFSANPPSSVLLKAIVPAPLPVEMVTAAMSVVAETKVTLSSVVVISASV